ncbi:MAG TPA: MFS transporter, partial [Thermoanaerobaculia bacterium]|nr:MFS transporter [Thermoanaerobaculia bacterium]
LIGVGKGRGMGLLLMLIGVVFLLTTAIGYSIPRLRRVEDDLPDALSPAVPLPAQPAEAFETA